VTAEQVAAAVQRVLTDKARNQAINDAVHAHRNGKTEAVVDAAATKAVRALNANLYNEVAASAGCTVNKAHTAVTLEAKDAAVQTAINETYRPTWLAELQRLRTNAGVRLATAATQPLTTDEIADVLQRLHLPTAAINNDTALIGKALTCRIRGLGDDDRRKLSGDSDVTLLVRHGAALERLLNLLLTNGGCWLDGNALTGLHWQLPNPGRTVLLLQRIRSVHATIAVLLLAGEGTTGDAIFMDHVSSFDLSTCGVVLLYDSLAASPNFSRTAFLPTFDRPMLLPVAVRHMAEWQWAADAVRCYGDATPLFQVFASIADDPEGFMDIDDDEVRSIGSRVMAGKDGQWLGAAAFRTTCKRLANRSVHMHVKYDVAASAAAYDSEYLHQPSECSTAVSTVSLPDVKAMVFKMLPSLPVWHKRTLGARTAYATLPEEHINALLRSDLPDAVRAGVKEALEATANAASDLHMRVAAVAQAMDVLTGSGAFSASTMIKRTADVLAELLPDMDAPDIQGSVCQPYPEDLDDDVLMAVCRRMLPSTRRDQQGRANISKHAALVSTIVNAVTVFVFFFLLHAYCSS
jgi:hypothetical protein